MAFAKIIKSSTGSHSSEPQIRMGSRMQSSTVQKRSIYIAISRVIAAEAGWTVTEQFYDSKADASKRMHVRVAINEGTGEDAGFLLLTEDENGYVLGSNKGQHFGYSLAAGVTATRFKHYVLNDVSQDIEPESVEYTVDAKERSVLIQCPDWLRYNPLSVPTPEPLKKEVVAAPVAPVTFRQRQAAKTDVTALVSPNMTQVKVERDEDAPTLNRSERRRIAAGVARGLRN